MPMNRMIQEDRQWSERLLKACNDDAKMGRMEAPRSLTEVDLERITLSPRYGVEQGVTEDGDPKVGITSAALIPATCMST